MYRGGPGSEAGEDERISYECRIKMKSQNLACKRFWLFFLFCKNANDTEMERKVRIRTSRNRGERLHGTHGLGVED